MKSKTRKSTFKRVLLILFFILSIVSVYLYINFNKLLSEALLKNFNSNVISDVYELEFEKLRVNFIDGDISVYSVVLKPREKPLNVYPYINSTFRLYAQKLQLTNVHIVELLKQNMLNLNEIEIIKPEIQLKLSGKFPLFIPVRDSTNIIKNDNKKKFIEYFWLKKFNLEDASIQVFNSYKQRDFKISNFTISLVDFEINQRSNLNSFSIGQINMLIGDFKGKLLNSPVRQISFSNYKLSIDSLTINKSIDTVVYKFHDFNLGLVNLDIHTADSLHNFKLKNFDLAYRKNSILLNGISYKPNVSREVIQRKYKYQNTQFSVGVDSLRIENINFDSIIYYRKVFIDEINLKGVTASLFKNNAKPLDRTKFPKYLGQMVNAIPVSLRIKRINATDVNLEYLELKPDQGIAKVHVNRAKLNVENITNSDRSNPLTVSADAYLENVVHTELKLSFSYTKTEFGLNGLFKKFNLEDLNPVINSFTPAKIKKGIVDEIRFSGTVYNSYSTGTMKFLYHDLVVDLDIQNKAKWKSSIGAFAANTYLHSSNPASPDLPPRIVKYRAERIMNKGFINIIVKSAIAGIKETMSMSKENRKAYHKSVKKSKGKK